MLGGNSINHDEHIRANNLFAQRVRGLVLFTLCGSEEASELSLQVQWSFQRKLPTITICRSSQTTMNNMKWLQCKKPESSINHKALSKTPLNRAQSDDRDELSGIDWKLPNRRRDNKHHRELSHLEFKSLLNVQIFGSFASSTSAFFIRKQTRYDVEEKMLQM